jgi:hypothetical protein
MLLYTPLHQDALPPPPIRMLLYTPLTSRCATHYLFRMPHTPPLHQDSATTTPPIRIIPYTSHIKMRYHQPQSRCSPIHNSPHQDALAPPISSDAFYTHPTSRCATHSPSSGDAPYTHPTSRCATHSPLIRCPIHTSTQICHYSLLIRMTYTHLHQDVPIYQF